MRIARVVGSVTLSRCHPSFTGASLRIVQSLSLAELRGRREPQADELVAWDQLGAGNGSLVTISEGAEASQPFRPQMKAVDVYLSAILDQIDLDPKLLPDV